VAEPFLLAVYGAQRDDVVTVARQFPGVTHVDLIYPETRTMTVSFGNASIDVGPNEPDQCVDVLIWGKPGGLTPVQVFERLHEALPYRMEMWESGLDGLVATTDPPEAP
jgi:hypothetical protein